MRPHPLQRKLVRDLWSLKGPLLAIVLVIASGISTYVAMLGTLSALDRAMGDFYRSTRFAEAFASLVRAPDAVARQLEEIPGVESVETRVVQDVLLDISGVERAVVGRLVSLHEGRGARLNTIRLRSGRLPDPDRHEEVVVSEQFAEAHGLEASDVIQAVINERRHPLRVVGTALSPEYVYAIAPGALLPDQRYFGVLWMGRKPLAHALDLEGAFNDVSLTIAPDASETAVLNDVDAALERWGCLGAVPRADQPSHWYLVNEIVQIRSTGLIMPLMFLGVAAFLMQVAMARAVGQQRRQIALLKAFGYGNATVALHYAQLVLVVGIVASVLGLVGGAWMGRGMTRVYAGYFSFPRFSFELETRWIVEGTLVGILAASLGAAHAIVTAVRMPPADAMRPPTPATYKPLFIERFGFGRRLGAIPLMVLRNVNRRPIRSSLSVLGIGCGVALLVVGNGVMDGMRYGIENHFSFAQRDDATVVLVGPRSRAAVHALEGLPGVHLAEGQRVVAARIRIEGRSRLVSLTGLERDAGLQRVLDARARPIELPKAGLLLTERLAFALGARAGDEVVLEILEERRPTRVTHVARVSDTFFGLGAYMDIGALNRLLGEGDVVNAANLRVDSAALSAFHREVKETPAIAGVAQRTDSIRIFEDTAAASMNTMTVFMTIFAAVIACGVAYNNARLILSERGRDLATMRVIGYRGREVRWVLLGELWLLTLFALPLGCLMGYLLTASVVFGLDAELYRLPFLILPRTYGYAVLVVAVASVLSGLFVARRVRHLDLVDALKTRE